MSGVGANREGVKVEFAGSIKMEEVKIVSDGDHNYVIPASKKDEFYSILTKMENDSESELLPIFNAMFSKYMKNPDDLKLYTDEI
jgi:hypothetical protein